VGVAASLQTDTELMEIIAALGARCCLTNLLHRRQQKAHQNGNDRDDDE
jgi:hypothetical protein